MRCYNVVVGTGHVGCASATGSEAQLPGTCSGAIILQSYHVAPCTLISSVKRPSCHVNCTDSVESSTTVTFTNSWMALCRMLCLIDCLPGLPCYSCFLPHGASPCTCHETINEYACWCETHAPMLSLPRVPRHTRVLCVVPCARLHAHNVRHAHSRVLQVVGMDPNPAMEAYSMEKAAAAGLQGSFRFVIGDAQQMPFEAASFDAAVVTLVRLLSSGSPVQRFMGSWCMSKSTHHNHVSNVFCCGGYQSRMSETCLLLFCHAEEYLNLCFFLF
jgi:hypothetical protein